MWDVRGVVCAGCEVLELWDVGMWDAEDVGCLGCGMFGMWHVGRLPGCGTLIYKMSIETV